MTNPNQLRDVLLFVCSNMADETAKLVLLNGTTKVSVFRRRGLILRNLPSNTMRYSSINHSREIYLFN